MTKAVQDVTGFSFNHQNPNRLRIRCDTKNTKIKMIPESLKFDLEGVISNEDLSVDGSE
ncbi:hypothetical protein MKY82_30365 [Paenibacillus sp. FSL W7-1279]|jgi:RimJ/RimL family protein N-acetyltransferase|uniref:hypothetical protein n=1 Tax=Paenibacillus sp. FSL W7-1332 TaxID=2921702 RepID=UPI0030D28184